MIDQKEIGKLKKELNEIKGLIVELSKESDNDPEFNNISNSIDSISGTVDNVQQAQIALNNSKIEGNVYNGPVNVFILEKGGGGKYEELDLEQLKELLDSYYTSLTKFIEDQSENILRKMKSLATKNHVTKKINELYSKIEKLFEELPDKLKIEIDYARIEKAIDESGKKTVKEINKHITSKIKGLKSTLENIEQKQDELNKKQDDILNILKDFEKELDNLSKKEDLAEINTKLKDIISQIERSKDGIKDYIDKSKDEIKNEIRGIVTRILDHINNSQKKIFEKIDESKGEILQNISLNFRVLITLLSPMIQNVQNIRTEIDVINNKLNQIIAYLRHYRPDPGGGGGSDPDNPSSHNYELVWVIAKDTSAAQELVDSGTFSDYPNDSDKYIIVNNYIGEGNLPNIEVNLDSPDTSQANLTSLSSLMHTRGFKVKKIVLLLGARVVSTNSPWRWDI